MYADTRGEVVVIATAVGVDAQGELHRLSLPAIARTDDPLIAEARVDQAIRQGRAADLCAEIARRVASGLSAVEVVEERHNVVARASGHPSLLGRVVHARCAVDR